MKSVKIFRFSYGSNFVLTGQNPAHRTLDRQEFESLTTSSFLKFSVDC